MNNLQRAFLLAATAEAEKANHPFPTMAACEAALESNWGKSKLAIEGKNLFGMKAHASPAVSNGDGTPRPARPPISLPTREFEGAQWLETVAEWMNYPDWASCFADRLSTLKRLSTVFPHYAAALRATDAQTYIAEVSKTWSTDPQRAAKVLSIYQEYAGQ